MFFEKRKKIALFLVVTLAVIGVFSSTTLICAKTTKSKMPIRMVVSMKDSESKKWKEAYTLYYFYNSKGDLFRIDLSTPDAIGSSWIPTIVKYSYKNGGKVSATATDSYGTYSYKFDKAGRITEKKVTITAYDPDPKKAQKDSITYTYDKKGNVISKKCTTSDPQAAVNKVTYKYNTSWSGGKKTIVSKYKSWSGFDYTETRKYNTDGLLTSDKVKESGGSLVFNNKYTYKMNKNGTVKIRYEDTGDVQIRKTYYYGSATASREEYLAFVNLDESTLLANSERNQK